MDATAVECVSSSKFPSIKELALKLYSVLFFSTLLDFFTKPSSKDEAELD